MCAETQQKLYISSSYEGDLHMFGSWIVTDRKHGACTGSNASHDRSTMTSLPVGMISCGSTSTGGNRPIADIGMALVLFVKNGTKKRAGRGQSL
jgi:hypothetical protein